jgi:hypothetical protein
VYAPFENALTIHSVHVDAGQIVVSGRSDLAEGACILTELRVDGQAQDWWLADACATIQRGEWHVAVALGQGDAPAQLDATSMYEVRAWRKGQPQKSVVLAFDLAGPPTPQQMLDTSLLAEEIRTPSPVSPDRPEGWQVYQDETYDFALSYPPDWTIQEVLVDGPGTPDDWPIVKTLLVLPAEWAAQLEQKGPPDPTRPPVVAPLHIEVCVGPQAQYQRAYAEPDRRETLEINGFAVNVERDVLSDQITLERYVFTHPQDSELRVVLSDMLTGFKERVQGNEAVAEWMPLIVGTFEFVD